MNRDLETLETVRIFLEAAQVYLTRTPPNLSQVRASVDAALQAATGRGQPRGWSLARRLQHATRMQENVDRRRAMRLGGMTHQANTTGKGD